MAFENKSSNKFSLILNRAKQLSCCLGLSNSPLLQRRRSRISNSNAGSSIKDICAGFNLNKLYIPDQKQQESMPMSQTVCFAHSEENSAAKIAKLCLSFLLNQRLDPKMRTRAAEMLQQAEQYVSTGNFVAWECEYLAADQTQTSHSGSSCRASGRLDNQAIARKLASLANQFCCTRAGEIAIERAGALLLPPTLSLNDFGQCLNSLLASSDSTHHRVALLMVLCAELSIRAVVQCNCLALAIIVNWCCQLCCCHIAPIVVVRGWDQFIGVAESSAANYFLGPSLLAGLLLIGCYAAVARFTNGN